MKVKCIQLFNEITQQVDENNKWLTVGKEYTVLEVYYTDSKVTYRVLADNMETPILVSSDNFDVIDQSVSKHWVILMNGSIELTTKKWSRPGFWEDFFNDDSQALQDFHDDLKEFD